MERQQMHGKYEIGLNLKNITSELEITFLTNKSHSTVLPLSYSP